MKMISYLSVHLRLWGLLVAFVGTLSACGGDDDPNEGPTQTEAPHLQAQSIAQGQKVDAATQTLELTYSAPVTVADAAGICLNGKTVKAVANATRLTVSLALEPDAEYTFTISDKALTRYGEPRNYAPAFTLTFSTQGAATLAEAPVNPNATESARQVYAYLLSQYGQRTLSGVMANVNNNNEFSDLVYATVGKHPALTCYDLIHLHYSPANWIDYTDTAPAEAQWKAGGLVSYMWHWNVPSVEGETDLAKYGFNVPGVNAGGSETDFDIREALKNGTWQNTLINRDIDKAAAVLKQLQNKGIAVLWRPLHEAAGNYGAGAWFWWGRYGTDYTKQLWRYMYHRMVQTHGLNNLIWVWTVQVAEGAESEALAAYPGDEYVDMVGTDIYAEGTGSQQAAFSFVQKTVGHRKMVTLSECGNVPDPSKCFAAGDTWSWFMVWYSRGADGNLEMPGYYSANTAAYWQRLAQSDKVVWREDMPAR